MVRTSTALAMLLLLAASLAAAGHPPGVIARSGDKITAQIDAGDTDSFAVDLATGGSFGVTVKGKAPLAPMIRCFDPAGAEVNVAALLKGAGSAAPKLKGLVPGPGLTGAWTVVISGTNATTGAYTAQFAVKQPSSVKRTAIVVPANGTVEIEFAAGTGATVKATVTEKSGGPIGAAQVLAPSGVPESGGGTFTRKKTKLTLTPVVADAGFGSYRLALHGGAADAVADVTIGVKFAKTAKRVVTLPPEMTVASFTPSAARQDDAGVAATVQGANIPAGTVFDSDGQGVAVRDTVVDDSAHAHFALDLAAAATYGPHTLRAYPPPLLGEPVVASILVVRAPDPVVTGSSLASIRQFDTDVVLDVTGTGFRDGGTLSVAGTGLSVGATSVDSATHAHASLTAAADATFGMRDLVFTQPAAGGGAAGTRVNAISVRAPDPSLGACAPAFVRQGDSAATVTLTGDRFRDGGTVSVSGGGVTVSSPTRVSDTSFTASVAVGATAGFGARDVTYAQPATGGSASVTLTSVLTVKAPIPAITNVSPTILIQGASNVTLTLTGTGFVTGATISVAGSGLTVGATNVVSATQATVSVNVALNASFGARDVTYTQPVAGGADAVTAASATSVNAPNPTLTSIGVATVTQGQTGVSIGLTGSGFRALATVSLGADFTVQSYTRNSDTSATVVVDVSAAALLGLRGVTYTQPAAGGGASATLANSLQVNAPAPTVTSVSPVLQQGQTSQTLTVTGTNFRSGGSVTLSGAGLTLGSTSVASATQATIPVTVADNATTGTRNVTFTQPAAGGGAAATGTNVLTINLPDPTLSTVSPSQVAQGATGTLTITGTGFRTGLGLATGSGVTLSNLALVSASQLTADYSVGAAATIATRDLTYTQPASGGGASVTKTGAYSVVSPAPTVTSTTPSIWLPGQAKFTAKIVGTRFNSGTTLTSSGTGVTITNLSSGSPDTEMTLSVSVAASASLGARDITITPGSGGGASATFTGLVTIAPADPAVTSFSHATLAQGATSISVTVTGQNFRSGDSLAASGSGVTFGTMTLTGTTQIGTTVSVTGSAATGLRTLTVTHSSGDGGRSGTLANAVRVTAATPTVTAVNPSAIGVTASGGPTRDVPVTLTGTNFMTGATLSLSATSGTGLTVKNGSVQVLSDTALTATLTVAPAATIALWNLQVANPASLGNSGTSGNALLDVRSSTTRTVNNVLTATGSAYGGERVTIYGAGFGSGDVVDFGSVRAAATQFLDANTLLTTVPAPSAVSNSTSTAVNVIVRATGGTSATLTGGYSYAKDDARFLVRTVWPPQGATGVVANLKRTALLLSTPCDTTTGAHGSTGSANSFWFQSGASLVSTARSFGPANRWLVLSRTSGTGLAGATYVVNVPTALTSLSGNPLTPLRLAALGTADQYSFGITAGTSDVTAPTLSTITPANSATGTGRMSQIVLVFSEEIDPITVTTANITFTQSATTIPAAIELASDLKTVTLTPTAQLAANTTYTTTITTGVADMCGNAFASNSTRTFTTLATDNVNPVVDNVIVESLPPDLDGSGTYVNSSGASGNAFDVFLPRSGFLLDVRYSDADSGIDDAQFSAKCSVAVGGTSANTELASNFAVTSTGATWRIPSGTDVTAAENVVFTFTVKDRAGNLSSSMSITVDVIDKNTAATGYSPSGHSGGDHDVFDSRQTWILRADFDAYTVTYSGTGSSSGATTSVATDGASDFDQALRYIGLGTGSMTSAAAATVNGTSFGTNSIVRTLVLKRIRELLRARFGIGEDGTRGANAAEIEFLLPGEQGSLGSLPAYSTSNSSNSSNAYSEITIGGTLGAESGATTTASTLGQAWYDERNLYQEANLNTGVANQTTGIYMLGMFKGRIGDGAGTIWREKVLNKFTTGFTGATAVGESSDDDDVLADTFVRSAAGNTSAQNTRFDAIMDAVELVALYVTSITAHEIGHSTGLVADGAPKTGLFGNAHYTNTFTEATSVTPNTSNHLDYLGNDMMAAATSLDNAVLTGSDFKRFSPLDIAYLLNRLFFDEGR